MISKLVMQKLTIAGKEYEYPDTTALVGKINELADAVNGILDYAPLEMAIKAEKPNIDIGELAFLSKENSDLQDEFESTRKALEQSEICCTEWEKQALDYKAENIALSGDLERTRRAFGALQKFVTKLYLSGKITDEQLEDIKKC